MFERFTDRGRRVMVLAQEHARLLGHNFIGTEHLLLGLINEGDGIAARALTSLGLTTDSITAVVEEKVPPVQEFTTTGSPPLTPVAKKSLEMSLRESLQLGHNYIGTEHILLGILRTEDAVAVPVLEQLGVSTGAVRQAVISLLKGHSSPLPPPRSVNRFGPLGPLRLPIAQSIPRAARHQYHVAGPVDVALSEGRLTGVVAGLPVDVKAELPSSAGTCQGTFAGADLDCTWMLAPNGQWAPDVPGWARGIYGGEAGELRGWFHLSRDFFFEAATIEGHFSGQPISVLIEASPASTPKDAFSVHGTFAAAGFSFSCTFPSGPTRSVRLKGSVDGDLIDLEAGRHHSGIDPRLRTVNGTYEGPSPLLLVTIFALLFFV